MQQMDEEGESPIPRPAMSEWSPEMERLTSIDNQLRMLRMEQIGTATGKTPKIEMLSGPKTAAEGMEFKHRKKTHYSLAARLLPHKREELLAKANEE